MEKRKELHRQFRLPAKPCFRKANKYKFADDLDKKYLINTHVGLKNFGKLAEFKINFYKIPCLTVFSCWRQAVPSSWQIRVSSLYAGQL